MARLLGDIKPNTPRPFRELRGSTWEETVSRARVSERALTRVIFETFQGTLWERNRSKGRRRAHGTRGARMDGSWTRLLSS